MDRARGRTRRAPRLLVAAAALLLAACGGDAADDGAPEEEARAEDATTTGTPAPRPPNVYTHPPGRIEEEEALRRGVEAARDGRWRLARVGGSALPAAVGERPGGCTLEVLSGELRVTGERFLFRSATRETCGGAPGAETVHRAEGTFEESGGRVGMTTNRGDAFAAAEGRFTGDALVIERLDTEGGSEDVRWEFEKT